MFVAESLFRTPTSLALIHLYGARFAEQSEYKPRSWTIRHVGYIQVAQRAGLFQKSATYKLVVQGQTHNE